MVNLQTFEYCCNLNPDDTERIFTPSFAFLIFKVELLDEVFEDRVVIVWTCGLETVLFTQIDGMSYFLVSAMPYTMGLQKVWFCACIASTSAMYVFYGAFKFAPAVPAAFWTSSNFRFTSISSVGFPSNLARAGLLLDGCPSHIFAKEIRVNSSSTILSLSSPSPVSANGWWIETKQTNKSDSADEVPSSSNILIEHSNEGQNWSIVQLPPWAVRSAFVPIDSGHKKLVDLQAPWQWILRHIAIILHGAFILASPVAGMVGYEYAALPSALGYALGCATSLAAAAASAAGYLQGWRSGAEGAIVWWIQAASLSSV